MLPKNRFGSKSGLEVDIAEGPSCAISDGLDWQPSRSAAASCWLLTRRLRTCAPTDCNEPLLIVVLEPFTVGWQRLRFCASKYFSERFETHRAASFVDSFRILDRVRPHVPCSSGSSCVP